MVGDGPAGLMYSSCSYKLALLPKHWGEPRSRLGPAGEVYVRGFKVYQLMDWDSWNLALVSLFTDSSIHGNLM